MAKSDSRFEYKAKLGRTDFDLSQRLGFTSAAGMCLPVWYDFASPGDSYYIQHDLPLLRSSVLLQPAMVDVKVHFETFFVPMQMLYQPFENTMFSLKNVQSSNFDKNDLMNDKFPLLDYAGFINYIRTYHMTDDAHADAFRLADLFGLCPDAWLNAVSSVVGDPELTEQGQVVYKPNFFPWQILAYNTISNYYSGYFLDDKSNMNHYVCNWDNHYGDTSPVNPSTYWFNFMSITQRPWDFDYFTSMYRSPIVSDQNLQVILDNQFVYSDLMPSQTTKVNPNGQGPASNENTHAFSSRLPSIGSSPTPVEIKQNFNTAMIRQMFANEKLAMITGRTKKNYDSQVLAHYGVSVPHDVKHDITMIHHDVYDLNVQEVTSLSSGENSVLGELAGKSYATGNGQQFKFTAPCHGVMMTIFSIEPKRRYFGGFDRINAVSDAFDFPTPEFDRLGNVPMFRYECGWRLYNLDPETPDTRENTDIIGWKERYYQNKRKYDKTTWAFGYSNNSFYTNNWSPYMLAFRPFANYIDYSQGTPNNGSPDQRPDLEDRFYIRRDAMNGLCTVPFVFGWLNENGGEQWDKTPWLVYQRDPFIVNSFIKAKKISWMSKDGEPVYTY